MVAAPRRRVDEAARDAGDEQAIVDFELDGVVELSATGGEHRVETLCLHDGTRESVEDETVAFV